MSAWLPTAVACLALVAWTRVLWEQRAPLKAHSPLPVAVRDAAIVSVYAALLGGLVASLGFPGLIGAELSTALGAAWRTAVLAAALYALTGTRRARGR